MAREMRENAFSTDKWRTPEAAGKTLLPKDLAREANVPFFSILGSDFIEIFVGVGPSCIKDLFKEARAEAPSMELHMVMAML
eukprot:CAMPEP_0197239398 /NCGR_PEP_ID=MMETSP1429-20130617/5878_1 /TAXON_ID=49237 /ORGANISM="Chaetoceros  sp., Strain UNC1202" /LENGTH=81 /DNA_ID=CAMNT_0042698811 /DNA_START=558 /DNA_END=801 /DNA_ORIENTATION=+